MPSSCWPPGLSAGSRPVSVSATASSAARAKPSDTEMPGGAARNCRATPSSVGSCAISTKLSTTTSSAASAKMPNSTSRAAPAPPKAKPVSIPASSTAVRASASRPMMVMKSLPPPPSMPRQKPGVSTAAAPMAATAASGQAGYSSVAVSGTSVCLASSLRSS